MNKPCTTRPGHAWQDQMKAKLINQESKAIATHPLSHVTTSDRAAGHTGEAWQAVVFFDGCRYSKFFMFFSSWSLYSESLVHTSTQSYSTSPARSLVTLLWLQSEQECTQTPDNHSITLSFGNSGSIQKSCTFLTSRNQDTSGHSRWMLPSQVKSCALLFFLSCTTEATCWVS